MIYGPPDAKKSFTIIDMANHIARGRDWQGLRTKRAGVVSGTAKDSKASLAASGRGVTNMAPKAATFGSTIGH